MIRSPVGEPTMIDSLGTVPIGQFLAAGYMYPVIKHQYAY